MQGLVDQKELTFNSSVGTQDEDYQTCQEWWMIGIDRERESGKAILSASFDDDDDDDDDDDWKSSYTLRKKVRNYLMCILLEEREKWAAKVK